MHDDEGRQIGGQGTVAGARGSDKVALLRTGLIPYELARGIALVQPVKAAP